MVGALAAGAGYAIRFLYALIGWVPAVAGPGLVLCGLWLVYPPVALIVAGLAISVLTFARAAPQKGRRSGTVRS